MNLIKWIVIIFVNGITVHNLRNDPWAPTVMGIMMVFVLALQEHQDHQCKGPMNAK